MARISATQRFKMIFSTLEKSFGRRERFRPHPPVEQALTTLLLKDGKEEAGKRTLRRVQREFVDLNEVRVCDPPVLDEVLGKNFPPGVGELITKTLTAIFNHSQAMNLDYILDLDSEQAKMKLRKLDSMPSRVAGELLLTSLGYKKLPEGAGLLRVAKRARIVGKGSADAQIKTLRRIVRQAEIARVFHAFEMLAERICTPDNFDCRGCPINEHCPMGVEQLKRLKLQEEKDRVAREAEEQRLKKEREHERKTKAKKQAATARLKKAIQVRSRELEIPTRKKRKRPNKRKARVAAGAKMVQASSAEVKPVRKKKGRRAVRPAGRSSRRATGKC